MVIHAWEVWNEARGQVEEEEPALGEMRFLGLREQPDAPYDVLEISIEVAGKDIACGLGYHVEFFHGGQWFQVSPPIASPAITQQIPVGTSTKEYPVPKGLFSPGGAYRLAAPGLGYCRILVEKSGSSMGEKFERGGYPHNCFGQKLSGN